jgi:rhomboid family GlyGly-CTERM serine protease
MDRATRRSHAFFLSVGAVVIALAAVGPPMFVWLAYQRAAILRGQLWRLLTAHLVHVGAAHLAWNLAGLALVAATLARQMDARAWAAASLAAALGSSLGVYFLRPEVRAMAGLSAVLHGLLGAGAVAAVRRGQRAGWLLLAVLAAKLASEQVLGAPTALGTALGGAIAVDAHLYGALAGGLAGLAARVQPAR